jgi:hypothetical protein
MAIGSQVPHLLPVEVPEPSNATLAIAFYEAARAEILERLNMRETTFLAWITVVGAILSFAAKGPSSNVLFEPRLLQLIPALCLPFSLAIYRHTLIIRYLGEYLGRELRGFLRQGKDPKERDTQDAPRHWDISSTLQSRIRTFLTIEGIAYTFFLAGVPAFCLAYLHYASHVPWSSPWLFGGAFCTAVSATVGVLQVARVTW